MKKFKDAKKATEEMFEEEIKKETEAPEEKPEKVSKDGVPENPQPAEEAPILPAEEAPAPSGDDMRLQAIIAEQERLSEENESLKKIIAELSRKQEEKLIDKVIEAPKFDLNAIAFADADSAKQMQDDYSEKMTAYVMGKIMSELSPILDRAKEGEAEKEKQEIIAVLAEVPELDGLKDMLPQIERIIKNNTALSGDNVPIDEKYITAYAIAKGVNSMNQPQKELSTEELFELYEKNSELQDMIEKKKLKALESAQQVPIHSASNGAVNAALSIKEKPKTFEEASDRTRKMFGLGK